MTKRITAFERNRLHKLNADGLDKAYAKRDILYHIEGDTMYIAGTDNLQDVHDDITKVHMFGSLTDAERYKMVKPILNKNPQITKLVGHSLGGVTALRLQTEYKKEGRDFEVTTYGAPVMGFWPGNNTRYRHPGDPISIFDLGKTHNILVASANPLTLHSYKGYAYDFTNHDITPVEPQITIPNLVNKVQTDSSYQTS